MPIECFVPHKYLKRHGIHVNGCGTDATASAVRGEHEKQATSNYNSITPSPAWTANEFDPFFPQNPRSENRKQLFIIGNRVYARWFDEEDPISYGTWYPGIVTASYQAPKYLNDLKRGSLPMLPDGVVEHKEPLPQIGPGWFVYMKARLKITPKGPRFDRYFLSPSGEVFRSLVEVTRALSGYTATIPNNDDLKDSSQIYDIQFDDGTKSFGVEAENIMMQDHYEKWLKDLENCNSLHLTERHLHSTPIMKGKQVFVKWLDETDPTMHGRWCPGTVLSSRAIDDKKSNQPRHLYDILFENGDCGEELKDEFVLKKSTYEKLKKEKIYKGRNDSQVNHIDRISLLTKTMATRNDDGSDSVGRMVNGHRSLNSSSAQISASCAGKTATLISVSFSIPPTKGIQT